MKLHVVSVFLGPDGGGNLLGVFLGADWDAARRQQVAADLGYSETVFVPDTGTARLHIHTPATELPLAGHPLVGTGWLLAELGTPVDTLRPPAADVPTWSADGLQWIRADPADAPEFDIRQLDSPADVEAYSPPGPGRDREVWAWADEPAGRVRARVFPTAMGIAEDEATGAAAFRLTALLARSLDIRQGTGSQILTRLLDTGLVEVGGHCRLVEVKEYR
jgi:predicted PhzF superfamily epimerase YddE/YHI9